jgi:hypothetical protein
VLDVLRAGPGKTVRVGILDGPLGEGRVESVEGGAVELSCSFEAAAPPVPALDLLLALPRPKVR